MQSAILSPSSSSRTRRRPAGEEAKTFRGRRLVIVSAIYDILATTPLIFPFSARAVLENVAALHEGLGVAGAPVPTFEPLHLFFVGLLASVVTIWSILRALRPSVLLGRLDGVTRLLFSGWMVWALGNGQSQILVGYLVIEFSFGVLQLFFVRPSS